MRKEPLKMLFLRKNKKNFSLFLLPEFYLHTRRLHDTNELEIIQNFGM